MTSDENMEIWDELSKTDPKHTKSFKRAGGFSGTALKPMWTIKRMTERFGPCGTGWGVKKPSYDVQHCLEDILVFCTVEVWYGKEETIIYGVGGDKIQGKNKYGIQTDDEAFKKAYTDAITNALKFIGVGADIHMGQFDDSKYVNEMRQEFSENKPQEAAKSDARPIYTALQEALHKFNETTPLKTFDKWKEDQRSQITSLPKDWKNELAGEINAMRETITAKAAQNMIGA